MADPDSTQISTSIAQIGSYRLVRQLGSGGMSSVFAAVHVDTGHEVAVKVLPRYLAKNATFLQRFLREAKTAESLEHPNIVAIFDRGSEAGRYYLVLEFVRGGDLHDRVRNQGPLSAAELKTVLKAVCEGLRYAAGKGLIHRDIKPANLLMTPEGTVKITDLGLALQVEDDDERVTRDGTTVGTVDYMAPEQARDSRGASVKSDMYSLGCTCYYLLTGSPPYPGGDVAEKLRRHAQDPPPDVRSARPELSESVAAFVQRMMAKRPEQRFEDYDALLAGLETVDTAERPPEPLYAIIDDEEEPQSRDFTLGGGDLLSLAEPPTTLQAAVVSESGPLAIPSEISLVELSELDETPARPHRLSLEPPAPMLAPLPRPGPGQRPMAEVPLAQTATSAPRSRPPSSDSVHTYILRGLVIGVVVVLIGVGIQQLVALSSTSGSTKPETTERIEPQPVPPPVPSKAVAVVTPPPKPVAPAPKPATKKTYTPPKLPPPPPPSRTPPVWKEPEDKDPAPPADIPRVAATTESKFLPEGGSDVVPTQIEGPSVSVHRFEPARPGRASSLMQAFDKIGGTVEIGDDGPFFEHDLNLGSRPRLIKAKAGYRPIIVIEAPTHELTKAQPAIFVLENNKLVLHGIDLVVRAGDLPKGQRCLFLLRGNSELMVADCSITVVGPSDRKFTLVQSGDPAAGADSPATISRHVSLFRTFVRGQCLTAAHVAAGPVELYLSRSILACGGAQTFVFDGAPGVPQRNLYIRRSVLCSDRSLIDTAGAPLSVRILASTLAHVGSHNPSPLLHARDGLTGSLKDTIGWLGHENNYFGWDGFFGGGPSASAKLPVLAATRELGDGSDATSRESPTPWSESAMGGERALPDFARLLRDRAAAISSSALPRGHLWEKAVEHFERLVPTTPGKIPATDKAESPAKSAAKGAVSLELDASDPKWSGDLGRFLAASIPSGATRVVVHVRGSGTRTMTPVRLDPGVALEVEVEAAPSGEKPLAWKAVAGARDEALLSVRQADLALTRVRLIRGENTQSKYLVRIEDGNLTLSQCWLTGQKNSFLPSEVGDLILFHSPTTKARPIARLADCWLQADGTVLTAELGRGIVALSNCLVSSRSIAFDLRPQNVRRDLFEADLWLDQCTVASEHDVVRLGRWLGRAPGPDRPWLVSSRRSVYLDAFDRTAAPGASVLCRADREAIGQGALTWQGEGDDYEMSRFIAVDKDQPFSIARPDVGHHWIDLWGRNHFDQAILGPRASGHRVGVRLVVEHLVPGEIKPGDFALEWITPPPGVQKSSQPVELGATLARIGVMPSTRADRHH
jgi:serine/threonine-protein kinase